MAQTLVATRNIIPVMLLLITTIGCDSTDHGLAEFARRTNEQQVRQNERMAQQATATIQQSREVAAATKSLVEHDAEARRELIKAHENLQQINHVERVAIDEQRKLLDSDRQDAAMAQVHDPVIAQGIITAGLALAACLPLLVTIFALPKIPTSQSADLLLISTLSDDLLISLWPNLATDQLHRLLPSTMSRSLTSGSRDGASGLVETPSTDAPNSQL